MKRELWNRSMGKDSCPAWPCPHCAKGTLKLDNDSLVFQETVLSKKAHSEEAWDPDWIDYRFTAWTHCLSCKGRVAITGTGSAQQEMVSDHDWEWGHCFKPQIWNPMPEMIEIPDNCPDDVKEALRAAVALHAYQRAACATRLRVALEFLMDHVGIPAKRKNSKGKFYSLSLHTRLTDYAKAEPEIGAQLMALKWLGNAGSHESEVAIHDLLDAFEVFEYALGEIVGKRKERVAKLAKSLMKKFAKTKK